MFCHVCGASLPPDSRLCPNCGTIQLEPPGAAAAVPFEAREIPVRTGAWISEGWNVVKQDLPFWLLIALIVLVVGGAVPIVVQGPLFAGAHLVALRKLRGEPVNVGMVFDGFQFFLPAFLACLLISVFTFIGAILCIIPAFVVAAIFQFAYLFIVDARMDFWPAMEASHAVVKKNYLGFTLFLLAYAGLNILGLLLCFVGLLVTLPITWVAVTAAYRDAVAPRPA